VNDIEFSHGSVTRRTWWYCEAHKQFVTTSGTPTTCSRAVCGGKKRERFEFCFTYTRDGVTKRARGQAAKYDEAHAAMEARKAELTKEAETRPVEAPAVTLAEYVEKWLVTISPEIAKRTLESYTATFRRHVLPTLGTIPLTSITRGQVMSLLSAKRASGLGKNSVRLIRAALSAAFTDALNQELVTTHPALKVGSGRGRKAPDTVRAGERREKVKALSRLQLELFLAVAAKDRLTVLFLFLADTGCRPSEALAVQWEDVDLVARTVHIHRALDLDRTEKHTKTNTGRYVDLSVRLVAALDRHQTAAEAEALDRDREPSPLVFPSEAGTPLDVHNMARLFRRLLVRAGLPKYGPYVLRHSYASHLFALSAPITYIANQMGHASPAITLSTYAHFVGQGDRSFVDKLEAWRTATPTVAELVGK
jgi:integrase